MELCGAGQDSLVEHLGGGSNVKDVKGIPGSYFAFAGPLHRLVESRGKKQRNMLQKIDRFDMLPLFLSRDSSL